MSAYDRTMRELEATARELNRASDEMNEALEAIEDRLEQAGVGVSVWLVQALDSGFADLGYEKIGGRWRLAVRQANTPGAVARPLLDAPRAARVRACEKLVDLLRALRGVLQAYQSNTSRAVAAAIAAAGELPPGGSS